MRKNSTVKINKIIIICIVFLFVAIIVKFAYVSLAKNVDGTNLTEFAKNRNTTKKTLYANRGTIYDSKGEVLAQNVNSYTVIAFLNEKRTEDENNPQHVVDKQMTAEKLAKILSADVDYILGQLNKDLYQVQFGSKGKDITELKKNEIAKLALPGISFTTSTKRYYKMGSFAPYIIGYAKKNDKGELVGEMGVEKYYNDTLKGKNGYTEYQKDVYGYQIPNTPSITKEPESGSDIYLTLDNNIQLMVENAISDLQDNSMDWLHMTIADAKTGSILGTSSSPTFNLNDLNNIENYMNPLVTYQYEPGSTMKVFSFMAAIENGSYKGDDTFKSGEMTIGNYTISDFNDTGWGVITYDKGFAYSSNIAAANLGLNMGKQPLKDFYKKLGFGLKTGIELTDEATGKVNFNYDIETATAAFGQGITTTPIQTIQALTTIANDGMMIKPYIVDKIIDQDGNITEEGKRTEIAQVASKETIDKMKDLMKDVVYSGLTDAKFYTPANVTLIGKTGTAQIADPNGGYLTGKYDYIRSFAGLFPYEDPQYIIYFSIKRYTGSYKTLANRVAQVIDAIAKKDDNVNENISHLDATKIIKVKSYLNTKTEESIEKIKSLGLTPIVIGNGDVIVDQYPKKNISIPVDNKIFLVTNKLEYIMPDVIGWSTNEIITYCNLITLKYKIEGYGKVINTSIPKDTKIDLKNPITINLG